MPLILGHRGYSAKHLENSMEAFRAALAAGMDGFELDVQPTLDGVCVVLHDDDLGRTARSPGRVRELRTAELPLLQNGEEVPRLAAVLELPARLINVELKGRPCWQKAFETVENAGALPRVLFSSFEHTEIFELSAACPGALCGLLWSAVKAAKVSRRELRTLPPDLMLHLPARAVRARPAFWAPWRERLVLWDLDNPGGAMILPFEPAILITEGI